MKGITISDIPEKQDLQVFLEEFIRDWKFSIKITYESEFWNTPRLRSLMESVLDMYSIDVKDKNRLVLVSDELNNNAVEHGSGENWKNIIEIDIEKKDNKKIYINIEVTDCGEGSADYMKGLRNEKQEAGFEWHHSIRGRGLFLITEKIVDNLYFKDAKEGGLIVWVEKTL